jgi:ribosome-binding factor A
MQLAKKVNLRNTPEITFILDESVEYGVNMSKKIEEVMAEGEAKSKEHDSAE